MLRLQTLLLTLGSARHSSRYWTPLPIEQVTDIGAGWISPTLIPLLWSKLLSSCYRQGDKYTLGLICKITVQGSCSQNQSHISKHSIHSLKSQFCQCSTLWKRNQVIVSQWSELYWDYYKIFLSLYWGAKIIKLNKNIMLSRPQWITHRFSSANL